LSIDGPHPLLSALLAKDAGGVNIHAVWQRQNDTPLSEIGGGGVICPDIAPFKFTATLPKWLVTADRISADFFTDSHTRTANQCSFLLFACDHRSLPRGPLNRGAIW
jgi:hypothetical protein